MFVAKMRNTENEEDNIDINVNYLFREVGRKVGR